ncbi:winged helix-turn-helix transcriptional regulator [Methanorbis rubei]|uniref:ArsR family transcriptional regulator n=1 Tax=Methanorbis rubei TaxID=3028300 RepID=A0AAE4MH23_9EURY|nr:hypothetical protein [Methanocorpusculaceae archaeon Cs1]
MTLGDGPDAWKTGSLDPDSRPGRIYLFVDRNPGCSKQQIVDSVKISRGSVSYHLQRLARRYIIYSFPYHGNMCYYTSRQEPGSVEYCIFSLITRERLFFFFQTLYDHPNATRNELAVLMQVTTMTVQWYLSWFSDDRILAETFEEKSKRYALTSEACLVYERITAEP